MDLASCHHEPAGAESSDDRIAPIVCRAGKPPSDEPGARQRLRLSEAICQRLRCPVCGTPLELDGSELHCAGPACGKQYPSVDGIPILINESRSVFAIRSFLDRTPQFFEPHGRLRRWLSGCLPQPSHNLAARKILAQMRELLLARSKSPKVLVVGGGVIGVGVDILMDDPSIEVVHSDVSVGGHIDCVCDGHDLPFADGSFDGVVIEAVLEHVLDPARCVEEIHRVLADGGLVYADTPFIAQVHGRQFDFTRFTRLGHRRLFHQFREIASGMSSGPGTALGWTLRYFVLSFFTRRTSRAVASGLSRLAFSWLKYLDYCLLNRPGAVDAAFGFYFLGQKSPETLSDAELLVSYRGGF